MEVRAKHHYDKSVETVFKCFGNKAATIDRFTNLGARNIHIETIKPTKTSLDLVVHREEPVDAPALLKKFIGEWNLLTQEEHWKGSASKGYVGDIKFSLKGVPVSITGKFVLAGDSKECVNDVTMNFESNVPLIGKKLADFVASQAKVQIQKEYELIRDSL